MIFYTFANNIRDIKRLEGPPSLNLTTFLIKERQ